MEPHDNPEANGAPAQPQQPSQPHPPHPPYPPAYFQPPYQQPPYYPPPYPYPMKPHSDTPLIALIISLVGLIYSCPPFVLPCVALYFVRKAREEMAAGVPFGPSSESYLKIARILAIVGISVSSIILLVYASVIFFSILGG